MDKILPHLKKKTTIAEDKPDLKFYHWRNEPFIPVEFSVAAYRFGHSMVRPIYRLNATLPDRQVIFSLDPNVPNLTGFREFPANWAIDWKLFFNFGDNAPPPGPQRIQPAYKIDSSLVNPLGNLPPSIASVIPSLAERNLLRGLRMGLPSGQAVARKIGVPVIPDDKLRVGKAPRKTPRRTSAWSILRQGLETMHRCGTTSWRRPSKLSLLTPRRSDWARWVDGLWVRYLPGCWWAIRIRFSTRTRYGSLSRNS